MLTKALRALGWIAYVAAVLVCFVAAGYFAFNGFVRRGVTAVPNLVGLPRSEVADLLSDQGLRLRRTVVEQYDDAVPAAHVVEQSPRAGNLVKRGGTVEIVVSQGPELLEVPDVTGKALQAAQVTLTAAGLGVGRTASVYAAGALPGTVVEQHPAAGGRVGRAAEVELFLCLESRTDTFVMPDLVYRDFAEVRRFFDRRGFRLGSVKFEPYEGISAGVVLRQFPLPGHPLRRHNVISLVVATDERIGA